VRFFLLLSILVSFVVLGFGLWEKFGSSNTDRHQLPPHRTDALFQAKADALLGQTFVMEQDYWFALVLPTGSKSAILVQLHRPKHTIATLPVSQTDRMNGISARFQLRIECERSRSWDKRWTEWADPVKEDGPGKAILDIMMPVPSQSFSGYWSANFELRNGTWVTTLAPSPRLLQNPSLLRSHMLKAGLTKLSDLPRSK